MTENQRGIGLLEVLISITVLGLIMTSVVLITQNSQDTRDRVVDEDNTRLQVETAFSRIQWDIAHIYSPLYFTQRMEVKDYMDLSEKEITEHLLEIYQQNANFSSLSYEGLPIPKFSTPEKTEFIFLTRANRRRVANAKESNFLWIRYALESGLEREGDITNKVLTRQGVTHNPFRSTKIDWNDEKKQVLMRNIKKIDFTYWDQKTKKWVQNLKSTGSGNGVIRAIQVKLTWMEAEDIEQEFIRVFRPLFPLFYPEDRYELERPEQKDLKTKSSVKNKTNKTSEEGDEDEE